MNSIISLKKHMEDWQTPSLEDAAIHAYRALMLAAGKAGHRAVPELGPSLEQKMAEVAAYLSPPVGIDVLDSTSQTANLELSAWADQAFRRHEASERDLRSILDVMAKTITSVAERDERYAAQVKDLTTKLRSIANIGDLALIRRSILESANSLTECVERVAEDGRQSLVRLNAQVEDYRARLVKSERLSSLDPLTGLSNRRRFEEQLDTNIRGGNRFCLILIDLNNFKEINDRYGHRAGDEVLKHFAQRLKRQFPSADLVARWGGDEFAIIITSNRRDAEARVHRIRRAALGDYTVNAGRQRFMVTIDASIGVAEWDGAENGHDMLERADQSMYLGKAVAI
jgi:diguanylate cyclase